MQFLLNLVKRQQNSIRSPFPLKCKFELSIRLTFKTYILKKTIAFLLILIIATAIVTTFISCKKDFEPSSNNLQLKILDLSSGQPIDGAKISSIKCNNNNLFTANCGSYSYYPDQYSDIQGRATIPRNYTNTVTKEKFWSYDNDFWNSFSFQEKYSLTSESSRNGFTIKMAPVSYIKVVIQRTLSAIYADTIKLKKLIYRPNGTQYPGVDTAFKIQYVNFAPIKLTGDTTLILYGVGDYLTELKYSLTMGNTNTGVLYSARQNCRRFDTTTFLINY